MVGLRDNIVAITLGAFGAALLGYCIYFDRKRHSDPDFKRKLRERRLLKGQTKQICTIADIPNTSDTETLRNYFIQQLHLGEQLIGRGEFDQGVNHLANAIIVSGEKGVLLQLMQSTLPPAVLNLLLKNLQEKRMHIMNGAGAAVLGFLDEIEEVK